MNNNKIVKSIIKYVVSVAIAIGMVFGVLAIRDYFSQTDIHQKFRFLSDAFVITGFSYLALCALFFVSSEGAFDGVGYALKCALKVFIPFVGAKTETYAEYKERKQKREKTKAPRCVLIVGVISFLIGIVFMLLFNYA